MATILRTCSVADMQNPAEAPPIEYNDSEYSREVLQLEDGETEALLDQTLCELAEKLGIIVLRPTVPKEGTEQENATQTSMRESAITVATNHARTASTGSRKSNSTGITSRSSNDQLHDVTRRGKTEARRSLSFSEYGKFLLQAEAQAVSKTGFAPPPIPSEPAPSLFSVSTRKSYQSIKSNFKNRFKLRRVKGSREDLNACVCCRDEFKTMNALQTLPCGHNYCDTCIRVLINQAATDEAKMPPRCCSKPIPGYIVKAVLSKEDQQIFMKSVLQFGTPWEARIFCPNTACGEFIPRRDKIDPRHPFEVVCRQCKTSACSICKRAAHAFGQDCPLDWELDAVLQMGEKSGWRRCYKCRNLVELTHGCSHITCRCKAQFCYICGAVWDGVNASCPNYCSGEEELERRRVEEEARAAEMEAEKLVREEEERIEAAEKLEAEKRTAESEEMNNLKAQQVVDRDRFCIFERRMKWLMWTRHGEAKLDILNRYAELQTKMKERHDKTSTHLEDRQVGAEMELRAGLKQAERSVQIRLRHMEAYCDGLGRAANGPPRVVTERDLRQLGEQYNVRDGLDRLHQSKINVMRDKQAKQMEQLLQRQEEEEVKLAAKQDVELEALDESFVAEELEFARVFRERKERMLKRWEIVEEVERKGLENATGVRMAKMPPPEWVVVVEEGLESVSE